MSGAQPNFRVNGHSAPLVSIRMRQNTGRRRPGARSSPALRCCRRRKGRRRRASAADLGCALDGIAERETLGRDTERPAALDLALAGEIEFGAGRRHGRQHARRRIGFDRVVDRGLRKRGIERGISRPHDVEIDDDARRSRLLLARKRSILSVVPAPRRRRRPAATYPNPGMARGSRPRPHRLVYVPTTRPHTASNSLDLGRPAPAPREGVCNVYKCGNGPTLMQRKHGRGMTLCLWELIARHGVCLQIKRFRLM